MADTEKPAKSVSFMDGAVAVDENGETEKVATNGSKSTAEGHAQDTAVDEVTEMFEGLAKKKKKKKPKEGEDLDDLDMTGLKKKKKKKSKPEEGDVEESEEKVAETEQEGDFNTGTGVFQHDLKDTIVHSLLLDRFFSILQDRNPELAAGSTRKYKIPPPQCVREGNKKTIFANLQDIADRLKRSEDHVIAFLFSEMGTSGSVDGSRRLVIKGRFQPKQIEAILSHYITDYVSCKTCRSLNTELAKGENRLWYLSCQNCGSTRTVPAIKQGFSAQIGKRKRMQG